MANGQAKASRISRKYSNEAKPSLVFVIFQIGNLRWDSYLLPPSVSQFISNYVSTNNPNSPQEPAVTTHSLTEGQKLAGCYALNRRLLASDATEVWLATDEVLGKDITLHFIPGAIRKDNRAIQELRLDIKRNRQLIHPNILRVYDLVEESERVAISMDVFEAESLAEQFKGGKKSKSVEIMGWVEQLAKTIEEAHKINVIHRDLNPGNLWLTSSGKLLVANFGIGKTIRDAQARVSGGPAAATGFESPQVLEGKPAARTDDVYSFGAVLYAALTGQAPAGVSPATLETLGNEALGVPSQWQATIVACLAGNPEDRPQTVGEALRRLTTAPAEPVAAVAPASKPIVSEPVVPPVVAVSKPVEPEEPEAAKVEVVQPVPSKLEVEKSEPEKPEPAGLEAAKIEPEEPAPVKKEPVIFEPLKSEADIEPEREVVISKPSEPGLKETPKESEVVKSYTPPVTPPAKPFERQLSKEFVPKLYPEESRFPTKPLAAAAILIVLAIIYVVTKKPASGPVDQSPEMAELRALSTPVASTPALANTSTPAPASTPKVQTSLPPASPPPAPVSPEKIAALEKAKAAAQAAEQEYAALLKQKEVAEAAVVEVQKTVDEKVKAVEPLKKAAGEAAAQRKKLEEDQKMAEAAAAEAQKIAAEKALVAETAKKSIDEIDKKNGEKIAAQQKAETEIATMQKTLAERQQAATESAKALTQAQAAKEQKTAVLVEQQRENERVKMVDTEAQRKRETEEAERRKVEQELSDMKKLFTDRMKELEEKRKTLETPGAVNAKTPEKLPATPPVIVPPIAPAITPPAAQSKAATPEPVKMASIPATPAPLPAATPAPVVVAGGNSLGIKFVPVGEVEFAVWQTRVKDFEAFAKSVNLRSTSWKAPGFKQGPDHPVVNVSWQEAMAFCKWLTDKEHKENTLPANQYYRLPSDLEWSKAVGLAEETGKTPEARDMGVQDVYPWGTQWPPPAGAGNYTGEETGSDVAIKGYDDGFAWTSPVGSFPPNKLGIYDIGGNVWQWCMDNWTAESKAKVLRGASWYNGALKLSLLSSCRVHAAPDSSTDNYGFRIIRATESAKPTRK